MPVGRCRQVKLEDDRAAGSPQPGHLLPPLSLSLLAWVFSPNSQPAPNPTARGCGVIVLVQEFCDMGTLKVGAGGAGGGGAGGAVREGWGAPVDGPVRCRAAPRGRKTGTRGSTRIWVCNTCDTCNRGMQLVVAPLSAALTAALVPCAIPRTPSTNEPSTTAAGPGVSSLLFHNSAYE